MGMLYFDNNATTRIADSVFEAMLPYLREEYGNASSIQHKLGRTANHAIEKARLQIAEAINCQTKEIFFSSGSTETINTVIRGISKAYRSQGNEMITCSTEHKAVLSTCAAVAKEGMLIHTLAVDRNGAIDLEDLKHRINQHTVLVCLMAANNETGILHPIREIAQICQEKGVLFFCDASQHIGKLPIDLQEIPIDMLCLTAHKFHGPKGAAALFIRRKSRPIQLPGLILGGNQEHGFRGGTYAVPQIVGLGEAIQLPDTGNDVKAIRDYFEGRLLEEVEEIEIHAQQSPRIPNTSNVHFKYVRGSQLMSKLPMMCLSAGSACVSGDRDPSHVLKAMGLTDEEAFCSLRFSFSKYNDLREIDLAIDQIKQAVFHIRKNSPIWQLYQDGLI